MSLDELSLKLELRSFIDVAGAVNEAGARDFLKSRYRAIAKANHPDQNHGNSAAEERFKEVAKAYAEIDDLKGKAFADHIVGYVNSNGADGELLNRALDGLEHALGEKATAQQELAEARDALLRVGAARGAMDPRTVLYTHPSTGERVTIENAARVIPRLLASADPADRNELQRVRDAATAYERENRGLQDRLQIAEQRARTLQVDYDGIQRRVRGLEEDLKTDRERVKPLEQRAQKAEESASRWQEKYGQLDHLHDESQRARDLLLLEAEAQRRTIADLRGQVEGVKRLAARATSEMAQDFSREREHYEIWIDALRQGEDPTEQVLSVQARETNNPAIWYTLANHLILTNLRSPELDHNRAEYVRYALFEALTKGDASLPVVQQAIGYSTLLTDMDRTDLAELVLDKVREHHPTNYQAWRQTAETVATSPTGQEQGRQDWIKFCNYQAQTLEGRQKEDQLAQKARSENSAGAWYQLATHLLDVETRKPERDHGREEYVRYALYEALSKGDASQIVAQEAINYSACLTGLGRTDLAEVALDEIRELYPTNKDAWAQTARTVAASPTANQEGRQRWIAHCHYQATGRMIIQ